MFDWFKRKEKLPREWGPRYTPWKHPVPEPLQTLYLKLETAMREKRAAEVCITQGEIFKFYWYVPTRYAEAVEIVDMLKRQSNGYRYKE